MYHALNGGKKTLTMSSGVLITTLILCENDD